MDIKFSFCSRELNLWMQYHHYISQWDFFQCWLQYGFRIFVQIKGKIYTFLSNSQTVLSRMSLGYLHTVSVFNLIHIFFKKKMNMKDMDLSLYRDNPWVIMAIGTSNVVVMWDILWLHHSVHYNRRITWVVKWKEMGALASGPVSIRCHRQALWSAGRCAGAVGKHYGLLVDEKVMGAGTTSDFLPASPMTLLLKSCQENIGNPNQMTMAHVTS